MTIKINIPSKPLSPAEIKKILEEIEGIEVSIVSDPEKWHGREVELNNRTYRFELTCSAFPEQYDVFLDNSQVAYFRLRGGWFSVECPVCGLITVEEYGAETKGHGEFNDSEREFHMMAALEKVDQWVVENVIT